MARRAMTLMLRTCCTLEQCSKAVSCLPAARSTTLRSPNSPRICRWQQHGLTTSTMQGSDESNRASSSSNVDSNSINTAGDPVAAHFEQMLEVMMQNPTVMQMMLSRMPEHMRRPEVLKAMLQDPTVRARMSALAQDKGLASIISSIDPQKMKQDLSAALNAGINPARLIERFKQSPSLAKAMENPRVMVALMDMASNGADALKKHEGDKEVLEAAMEAGDILQQLQQEGATSAGDISALSSGPSSSMAAMEQQLGVSPQELMQQLMSRPELLAKVQDPEVQKALQEVAQSPWKLIKYMFNTKVLSALKDMKDVIQASKH